MKLNAPTQNFWWVAVVVGVLGVLAQFISIPFITTYAFWFVTVAFVILVLSTTLKGM